MTRVRLRMARAQPPIATTSSSRALGRLTIGAVGLVVAVVLLAACGGDEPSDESRAAPEPARDAATSQVEPEPEPGDYWSDERLEALEGAKEQSRPEPRTGRQEERPTASAPSPGDEGVNPAPSPDDQGVDSDNAPSEGQTPRNSLCDDDGGYLVSGIANNVSRATDTSGEQRLLFIAEIESDLMTMHGLAVESGEQRVATLVIEAIDALDAPDFDGLSWLHHPLDVSQAAIDACIGTQEERDADQQQRRDEFLEGAQP